MKKIKKIKVLAAGLCVAMTFLISYLIYDSEYKYTNDKGSLSAVISKFTSPREIDAYVIETKEINGLLVVSFKDQAQTNVYGIAELHKGINQKYRIVRAQLESSDYSSVVQVYPLEIKKEPYYVVSGHNISDEIKYYGLDYTGYTSPGNLSRDRVKESITFDIKNNQFLDIIRAIEVDNLLDDSIKDNLHHLNLLTTSMYNADGEEVTEQYISNGSKISSSVGKAELFMLYVYISIVLGFGFILTRYVMTN